jgi:thioredoxin 1
MALTFTDANFEKEVKQSDQLTFVDFWAPWCGPCQMTGPIVEELSKELEGKVKIGKMNVDENPHTPGSFEVLSIPTFMLFKNGTMVDHIIGGVQKEKMLEMINKHI